MGVVTGDMKHRTIIIANHFIEVTQEEKRTSHCSININHSRLQYYKSTTKK